MKVTKNQIHLLLIILLATVVRVLIIWIGRPEFVGWFNHTYYYYVEVKGLLENGKLPFPDMPLLFYIYAFTSKVLIWFGVDLSTAVVSSTRFWMSIIPSLIPVPVYLTLKSINYQKRFDKWLWVIVFVSAFLPLSLLHITEFLQKNALGILLLAVFMFISKKTLLSFKTKNTLLLAIIFVLIILTHYGSAGVTVLYVFSIFVTNLFIKNKSKSVWLYGGILAGGLTLAIITIYFFDIQRFERIFFYIQQSSGNSFFGVLFSADSDGPKKIEALLSILAPIVFTFLFYKLFRRNKDAISEENRQFWLSNIVFCYLLVLPVYDQLLFARFTIFLSLPVLFILVFTIKYSIKKKWLKNAVLVLTVFGTLMIAFGEFISLKFHNRNKNEIYADLMTIKQQQNFQQNDLIITKNGTEHICNWFLNTKSGVITSLNLKDFSDYENIYILNPIEGALNFEGIENKEATNEKDKYTFMLRNIPKPQEAKTIYESEYIQLLFLVKAPEEWKFDGKGYWVSY